MQCDTDGSLQEQGDVVKPFRLVDQLVPIGIATDLTEDLSEGSEALPDHMDVGDVSEVESGARVSSKSANDLVPLAHERIALGVHHRPCINDS
jgi:hypothetical protein